MKIGDSVTFKVEETDLQDRKTGKSWFETGTIEAIEKDHEDIIYVRVRVTRECCYILDAKTLEKN